MGGLAHFYKGMDVSSLPQSIDEGMRVKDADGNVTEPFALMKKYGVNSIRLRIWVNPEKVPETRGYCSLAHTLEMAKRIRENGMSFLLDFHYSDWWADPGQQRKPSAWEGLDRQQLEEKVYEYTRSTLLKLKEQNTLPDMVQIGNEIRSGLLFPEGELPDYEGMVRLVNAGIRGARSVAGADKMQVMIHLDQGGRYNWLHRWFEGALSHGLEDFDLIGISYYPFWHGTFLDLKASMEQLVKDYHKPILIVETAYAWRSSEKGFVDDEQIRIGGLPATPAGQKRNLDILMYLLETLPENRGRGIYYWEPVCVPKSGQGGWEENMGLLDEEGRVMEGMSAFAMSGAERAKEPACWKELVESLQRRTDSGAAEQLGVFGIGIGENLLENGDFAGFTDCWEIERSSEDVAVCFKEGEPGSVSRIFVIESPRNFKFRMETKVRLQKPGRFCLSVEAKGADTTGVDVRLYGEAGGNRQETVIHPVEQWTVYRLEIDGDAETVVKAGIDISSPPIGFSVRNFRLLEMPGVCAEAREIMD